MRMWDGEAVPIERDCNVIAATSSELLETILQKYLRRSKRNKMELVIAIGIERTLAKQIGVSAESCLRIARGRTGGSSHHAALSRTHGPGKRVAEHLRCVSYPPFSLQLDGYGAFVNESPKESRDLARRERPGPASGCAARKDR
jgi:hypothetical protein